MTDQINHTEDTLDSVAHVDTVSSGAAVGSSTLTLAEMNNILGKDFKDKDSALKAIKDTFSYVGKRQSDIEEEVRSKLPRNADTDSIKSDVARLKNDLFFATNPQFKGYEAIISKMGSDPAEVTGSSEFKTIFDKVKAADEAVQKRSVVSSNPRLAETKTAVESAVNVANARGSTVEDVALTLARSINNHD